MKVISAAAETREFFAIRRERRLRIQPASQSPEWWRISPESSCQSRQNPFIHGPLGQRANNGLQPRTSQDSRVHLIDEGTNEPKRSAADVTESSHVQDGRLESEAFHFDDIIQGDVEGSPRPVEQLEQRIKTLRRHGTSKIRFQHGNRLQAEP